MLNGTTSKDPKQFFHKKRPKKTIARALVGLISAVEQHAIPIIEEGGAHHTVAMLRSAVSKAKEALYLAGVRWIDHGAVSTGLLSNIEAKKRGG